MSFVIVMTPRYEPKAAQGKVHFCGRNVGQRTRGRRGPAPGPVRDQGAGRPGRRAARRHPGRPPPRGDPAAVIARAGRGSGRRPQHRRRGLQPAGRRGMADRPHRVGDLGRPAPGTRARCGGHGPARAGGAPLRPARRSARPVGVPAPRLARDGPQGPRQCPRLPARLPRSARAAAAASRPGRLPGPGAGRDRRSRAHRHLRGLRARPGRHQPRAARSGLGHPRGRGVRPPDPPRHRGRAGPAPAAAAGRRHGRRRSAGPPGRTRCC